MLHRQKIEPAPLVPGEDKCCSKYKSNNNNLLGRARVLEFSSALKWGSLLKRGLWRGEKVCPAGDSAWQSVLSHHHPRIASETVHQQFCRVLLSRERNIEEKGLPIVRCSQWSWGSASRLCQFCYSVSGAARVQFPEAIRWCAVHGVSKVVNNEKK